MTENQLISILIPAYRIEKYIGRCLDSVINQTYNNIEILVVWQPSEDNTLKILEKYQKLDDRIRLIKQPFPDLASARNRLIQEAKGDIVCFVDSDDYIDEEFVRVSYKAMYENNADIVIAKILAFKDQNKIKKEICIDYETTGIYDNVSFMKSAFTGKLGGDPGVMQGKLYKKSLFQNIQFPRNRLSEDNATIYKVYWNAERVVTLNNYLYYYQSERDDSIMHKKDYSTKLIEAAYINRIEQFDFFYKKNSTLASISAYSILTERMRVIGKGVKDNLNKNISEFVEKNKTHYLFMILKNKNSIKIKFISILCVFFPNIMYKIWNKRKFIKYKNEWRKKES